MPASPEVSYRRAGISPLHGVCLTARRDRRTAELHTLNCDPVPNGCGGFLKIRTISAFLCILRTVFLVDKGGG